MRLKNCLSYAVQSMIRPSGQQAQLNQHTKTHKNFYDDATKEMRVKMAKILLCAQHHDTIIHNKCHN